MYVPTHCAVPRVEVLQDLIRLHSLATLVAGVAGELEVTHIPMVLELRGPLGTRVGHVARANPLWQRLGTVNAVAIFKGRNPM